MGLRQTLTIASLIERRYLYVSIRQEMYRSVRFFDQADSVADGAYSLYGSGKKQRYRRLLAASMNNIILISGET